MEETIKILMRRVDDLEKKVTFLSTLEQTPQDIAFHFERNGTQRYITRSSFVLGNVAQSGDGTVTWQKNNVTTTLPVTLATGDVLSAVLSGATNPVSTAVTLKVL
jgi:hypothetical protein